MSLSFAVVCYMIVLLALSVRSQVHSFANSPFGTDGVSNHLDSPKGEFYAQDKAGRGTFLGKGTENRLLLDMGRSEERPRLRSDMGDLETYLCTSLELREFRGSNSYRHVHRSLMQNPCLRSPRSFRARLPQGKFSQGYQGYSDYLSNKGMQVRSRYEESRSYPVPLWQDKMFHLLRRLSPKEEIGKSTERSEFTGSNWSLKQDDQPEDSCYILFLAESCEPMPLEMAEYAGDVFGCEIEGLYWRIMGRGGSFYDAEAYVSTVIGDGGVGHVQLNDMHAKAMAAAGLDFNDDRHRLKWAVRLWEGYGWRLWGCKPNHPAGHHDFSKGDWE